MTEEKMFVTMQVLPTDIILKLLRKKEVIQTTLKDLVSQSVKNKEVQPIARQQNFRQVQIETVCRRQF